MIFWEADITMAPSSWTRRTPFASRWRRESSVSIQLASTFDFRLRIEKFNDAIVGAPPQHLTVPDLEAHDQTIADLQVIGVFDDVLRRAARCGFSWIMILGFDDAEPSIVEDRLAALDRSKRRALGIACNLGGIIVDFALARERGIDRNDVVDGIVILVTTRKISHAQGDRRLVHVAENFVPRCRAEDGARPRVRLKARQRPARNLSRGEPEPRMQERPASRRAASCSAPAACSPFPSFRSAGRTRSRTDAEAWAG